MKKIDVKPSTWEPLDGIRSPDVIRSFDGVNTLNPIAIKESYATTTRNFTSRNYPSMTQRDGYGKLDTFTSPLVGLFLYQGNTKNELHTVYNGMWHKYQLDGTFTENLVTSQVDASSAFRYSFCHFKGDYSDINMIVSNGVRPPMKYNGTSAVEMNAPTMWYIATHDNRVYGAKEQTVYFSALRKAEDWTTVNDAGQIVLDGDSEVITGIVAGPSKLTVFKTSSIYELYGNGPSSYQMRPLSTEIGTVDGNSVQMIDGTMYFVSLDGIYKYSGGSKPSKTFSLAVEKYLYFEHDIAPSKPITYRVFSWQYEGRYYVQLQNPYYGRSNYGYQIVLEYDPKFETWYVHEYPFRVTTKGIEFGNTLYLAAQGTEDSGNYIARVSETYKVDHAGGSDGGPNPKRPISYEWISKPFNFDAASGRKKLMKLWVVADIDEGSTLSISISDDPERNIPEGPTSNWKVLQSFTAAKKYQSKEIVVPVNWSEPLHFYRIRISGRGYVKIHEIARQDRDFMIGVR